MRERNKNSKVIEQASLNSSLKDRLKCLTGVFVFFWPLVYLFHLVLPINGRYTGIGNDFILLYYKYKVYLLACLAEWKFPLWSPSEGCGFPFYINPFAQAFYPLNLLLVLWYKISGGYNPIDHQVFTILGISIFALGIYKWLRLINSDTRAVILSTIIISVSFKITEILRFPNAVHTAAWYPWVLYAITKIFKSQSFKDSFFSGIILVLALICFCTAGYPYYVYYSQFLFVPYFVVFLIRPFRRNLLNIDSVKWKRVLCTFAVCAVLAALVCGPYFLGIKNLMSQVTERTGKDFSYSTDYYIYNFIDTVGSLVYPPASEAEGWYFFSITALLIILLYLFTKSPGQSAIKVFFVLWIAVISYISYGKYSYLFIFLWNYMPGFSSLRIWGRMNIILLPILAWLLSLSFNHFQGLISGAGQVKSKGFYKRYGNILTLILIYIVILCVQFYLHVNKVYDTQWKDWFQNVWPYGVWFIYLGVPAFAFILLILAVGRKYDLRSGKILVIITSLLAIIAIFEMWPVGTHSWTYKNKIINRRINLDVDAVDQASFSYPRTNRKDSISLNPVFNVSVLPSWYFNRYVEFLKKYSDDLRAQEVLLGVISGQKVFFSESIVYDTIKDFLRDSFRYQNQGRPLSYTGDKLEWEIDAPAAGYISFIDNWDSNWKVFIDGRERKMELLFGTFKSVAVDEGRHQIKFIYKPGLIYK